MVLLSAFVAAHHTVLPSLPRPIPAIITLTLIDLINNPEYPVSPDSFSADAFSNPSIQNTNFNKLEEKGQEGGVFRQITILQIIRANIKELVGK